MRTRSIPVHYGTVAQIACLYPRKPIRHRLVKFHKAKISIYNIDIVLIIYIHFPAPNFFSDRALPFIILTPKAVIPIYFHRPQLEDLVPMKLLEILMLISLSCK